MKRKIFSTLALAALATSVLFTSCKKEDPATPVTTPNVMAKTAKIVGYVLMQDDLTATKPTYSSPKNADFKMIVTVPYSDLISGDVSGKVWSTTSVDEYIPSTGKFTVTVPVGFGETNVSLTLNDFTGTRTNRNNEGTKIDENVIWQWGAAKTVKVIVNGQTKYMDGSNILTAKVITVSGDPVK